ncbi:SDR family NAD(P)-dependent oxidoreductase [Hymenobacter oligotrophus]|uniref:SDR family NAD(P)-dependent oxidoreductase n=1 Tax=Hymenobacter oligotrophus TaxID=2319843 RepID=A0A3B7R3J3_9BACT|nr:NAD(P)H-binding protein [Hymenobacter oligotrophus]AYA36221.1 SDR family NAD(P)-dependent oxidoreductase [Hymenobacter oligotrophus]
MNTPSIAVLGCGWLGLPLGSTLAQAGYQVAGSTTTPEKLALLKANGIQPHLLRLGPSTPPSEIAPLLAGSHVLVLSVPPSRTAPERAAYPAALAPVVAAVAASAVRHVVFISSTGVYPDEPRLMTEADAVATAQAENHLLQAEALFGQPSQAWQTAVLRLGGLMGPGRAPGRFLAGRTEVPQAQAPVNMLHLDDAVGVVRAVIEQQCWGVTLNVCAPAHPTRAAFYQTAAAHLGLPAPMFSPHDERSGKCIDTALLQRTLSYKFRHPEPEAALNFC